MTCEEQNSDGHDSLVDESIIVDVAVLRKTVFMKQNVSRELTCSRSTMYGVNRLLSTTIKEEEEEDMLDNVGLQHAPLAHRHGVASSRPLSEGACKPSATSAANSAANFADDNHSHQATFASSRRAANAVASVAAATSKVLKRLLHPSSSLHRHHHHHDHHGQEHGQPAHRHSLGIPPVLVRQRSSTDPGVDRRSTGMSPRTPVASPKSPNPTQPASPPTLRPAATATAAASHMPRPTHGRRSSTNAGATSAAATASSPAAAATRSPCPHLVRLIDGDDVSLGLRALQLAAEVHDHVFGPAGLADPVQRTTLLEAAGPLYDEAMTAARAIRHPALQSLVKEAVRRYVNPRRGAPDDVLRLILELLTGAGATAAAGAGSGGAAGSNSITAAGHCGGDGGQGTLESYESVDVRGCGGNVDNRRAASHRFASGQGSPRAVAAGTPPGARFPGGSFGLLAPAAAAAAAASGPSGPLACPVSAFDRSSGLSDRASHGRSSFGDCSLSLSVSTSSCRSSASSLGLVSERSSALTSAPISGTLVGCSGPNSGRGGAFHDSSGLVMEPSVLQSLGVRLG